MQYHRIVNMQPRSRLADIVKQAVVVCFSFVFLAFSLVLSMQRLNVFFYNEVQSQCKPQISNVDIYRIANLILTSEETLDLLNSFTLPFITN